MSLGEGHKKFFDQCWQELQAWIGIDMEKYHQYFELNHKDKPKRQRSNRKPRREKEQAIRKLRNPREYKIVVNEGGKRVWKTIVGEPSFSIPGIRVFHSSLPRSLDSL
ncbi:hypothetical protein [Brevibacillus parabrevis]|uniref:hypothetical protein n=1 Tax=Brevibacillus parabrevis TaxID=54914 RepID=UPI000F0A54BF|nr:hypothetical protein [Brevibacillus parabrevis]RNB95010.1 hypothetical protein EDM60_14160 [Brevibacillus parabrevis]